MQYLDRGRMEAIESGAFQEAHPFPWTNPAGFIAPDGYEQLRADLPPVGLFKSSFGMNRAHGQQPHDRYTLEYRDSLPVADSWKAFVGELKGPDYRAFIARLFGIRRFFLTFHWHYTPNGCSVSPHCDAPHKVGSHIFYFNTEEDWDPAWGGETLILDDKGRFPADSAPAFEDFGETVTANALGNNSLLFGRRGNSWHGVREIACPPNRLRKVFIVVVNSYTPKAVIKSVLRTGTLPGWRSK